MLFAHVVIKERESIQVFQLARLLAEVAFIEQRTSKEAI